MGIVGFTSTRRGQKTYRGGGNAYLNNLEYENGEKKRIVIPVIETEENGKKRKVIGLFSKPIHKAKTQGALKDISKANKKYNVNQIRCTHPNRQVLDEDASELLEKYEDTGICVLCEIERLETRHLFHQRSERYTEEEWNALTKKEKKEFYADAQEHFTVEGSSYRVENEDGTSYNATTQSSKMLIYEIMTDANNKPIVENGQPKYKPVLMGVTGNRLGKFEQAIEDAISAEQVEYSELYPIVENEGRDNETKILVGWVEFQITFPKESTKMASGRNMTVTVMPKAKSIVSDEFIASEQSKLKNYVKQAQETMRKRDKHLTVLSREQVLDLIQDRTYKGEVMSAREYLKRLREDYEITEENMIYNEDGTPARETDQVYDAQAYDNLVEADKRHKEYLAKNKKDEKGTTGEAEAEAKADGKEKEETDEERRKRQREYLESLTPEQRAELVAKQKKKKAEAKAKAEAEAKAKAEALAKAEAQRLEDEKILDEDIDFEEL